jgi:hypothetical protein
VALDHPTTFGMLRSNVRTALVNVGCEENNCRFVRLMREVSEERPMELRARASLGHAHTAACPTATSRLGSHRPPSEQIADVFERRRIDAGNVTLPWIERGRRPGGMKRCRPDIPQLVSHRLRGWNFYNPGGPGGSAFGATNEGGPLGGGVAGAYCCIVEGLDRALAVLENWGILKGHKQ